MTLHRAVVGPGQDPTGRGRAQINVPDLGTGSQWAELLVPIGSSDPVTLEAGAAVWVMFHGTDFSTPVVVGRMQGSAFVAPVELDAEVGHDDGARPGGRRPGPPR